ncbi:MAG TPA: exodeoxyribonuclease I, partial [Methylibium sp.]
IRERLFSKAEDLPEGIARLPIKGLHINKSPVVIGNLKTLRPEMAQRWGIDVAQALRHAEMLAGRAALPRSLWEEVYARPKAEGETDVDEDLYGGFVGNDDRRTLTRLRGMSAEQLAAKRLQFEDGRLDELLFRYRARNFAESLTDEERERWRAHCAARLHEGQGGALALSAFFERIDALGEQSGDDERSQEILGALYDYAEAIAPEQ